jgi:hypothetical protein
LGHAKGLTKHRWVSVVVRYRMCKHWLITLYRIPGFAIVRHTPLRSMMCGSVTCTARERKLLANFGAVGRHYGCSRSHRHVYPAKFRCLEHYIPIYPSKAPLDRLPRRFIFQINLYCFVARILGDRNLEPCRPAGLCCTCCACNVALSVGNCQALC